MRKTWSKLHKVTLVHCLSVCLSIYVCRSQRYMLIDEEDMVQATQSDISTLCGQNLLLWMQYLELVTFNKIITHHLAKEHHLQRVCFSHILTYLN